MYNHIYKPKEKVIAMKFNYEEVMSLLDQLELSLEKIAELNKSLTLPKEEAA